jgi:spermidine/putrescine transport system ATP-binding protein
VNKPAVEVNGLVKRFGAVTAVDDLSLTVQSGEFLSLLGPSGCGKTTTLRMIGGLEAPTAGTVVIGGSDVTNVAPSRRPTSIVFQDYALFPHKSVLDNVSFGLKMRGVPGDERRRRAEAMLETVNLAGFGDRRPAQLSGGQRQRVALARSLVVEPEVLLLDEPLGALDALIRRQMQSELHRLQRTLGLTFIYVTHDQEEAMAMSDRLVVMAAGRIAQSGPPEEVYRRPRTAFVARFLGECNLIPTRVLRREPGGLAAENTLFGEFIVPGDRAFPGAEPGQSCLAAIRPEDLHVQPVAAGQRTGRVAERSYLGARTRYVVATGDLQLVAVAGTDFAPQEGEETGLSWRYDNVCLVALDAEPGATQRPRQG